MQYRLTGSAVLVVVFLSACPAWAAPVGVGGQVAVVPAGPRHWHPAHADGAVSRSDDSWRGAYLASVRQTPVDPLACPPADPGDALSAGISDAASAFRGLQGIAPSATAGNAVTPSLVQAIRFDEVRPTPPPVQSDYPHTPRWEEARGGSDRGFYRNNPPGHDRDDEDVAWNHHRHPTDIDDGFTPPPPYVPEPASLMLLAAGGVGLLARRGRSVPRGL